MFFFLALLATVSYALQNSLMASYYRSMDRLSAVVYRGISLSIGLSPLLYFVPRESFGQLPTVFPLILLASSLAIFGNWAAANSFRYLPVGIASALNMSCSAIVSAGVSYAFLGERLRPAQLLCILGIVILVTLLGRSKIISSGPVQFDARKGTLSTIIFGLLLGFAYVLIGSLTRSHSPLMIGFLWESTITVLGFLLATARGLRGGLGFQILPRRDFARTFRFCLPAALGTACYVQAVSSGPVGIVTAVLATMMVWNSLFSYLIYSEKLSRRQWVLIACAALAVACLRIV